MTRLSLRISFLFCVGIQSIVWCTAQAGQVHRGLTYEVKHDVSLPLREIVSNSRRGQNVDVNEADKGKKEVEVEVRHLTRNKSTHAASDGITQSSAATLLAATIV